MTDPAPATAVHPLEPLTAAELERAAAAVRTDGRCGPDPAFAYVTLDEPAKDAVLAWEAGGALPPRRALAVVLDRSKARTFEARVELDRDAVLGVEALERQHAPIVMEEFFDAQKVAADPRVWAALQRRGVTDPATVYVEPWPAGWFDEPYDDPDRRLGRCVFYVREAELDQPWARPVHGVVAVADRATGEVVHLIDEGDVPVPGDPGRFDVDSVAAVRADLKPLEITQPDGPSFTLEGHALRWRRWAMRLSMHPIEGLVLHRVTYDDPEAGRVRDVMYRGAMAEMVVPYGDPQGQHFWRHVFDEGEVGMGRSANSLELGCDCLGEIRYLDAPMVLSDGTAATISNAVCIHEEDQNALWKHTDKFRNVTEVRRDRRLVVSFWATLGNYDYGYFWYFHQDGSFEMEVKLTGIVLAGATHRGAPARPYGARLTPELEAPHHQHFFSFRLDLDVDGRDNVVEEVEVVADEAGPQNPWGNAFRSVTRRLGRESEAVRDADPLRNRSWKVLNPGVRNALGDPVGYQLVPTGSPLLLSSAASAAGRRAGFARHHLWVTPYSPDEMRAAGTHPNQHPGGAGLPSYVAADRSLDGADVVLWVTCGVTHVARPEEWPIMSVERTGFHLRPHGFFDRNPALDVAPPTSHGDHCH